MAEKIKTILITQQDPGSEKNPYVDAWWKWWPTARKTLSILRITVVEPLMHTSTWKLLTSLKEDPMPKLELNINSNLGVKPALVDKMVELSGDDNAEKD